MYASIRHYKTTPGSVDELVQRVSQGFVPLVSQAPGFVGYLLVDAGENVVASVSIFQDEAGAQESNRLAADWVKENIASLFAGPPEITAGLLRINRMA